MMTSVLAACATPPDVTDLQNKNSSLQSQLDAANTDISKLKANETLLNEDLNERDRVIGVLNQEKSSQVVTSTALRGQVRQYIQQQIDSLKSFLLKGNLLDYIGGELVKRSSSDEEPIFVVEAGSHPSSTHSPLHIILLSNIEITDIMTTIDIKYNENKR